MTFYSLFLVVIIACPDGAFKSPGQAYIINTVFPPILSKLHAAPGMTSFLLLLWLLHLRHRQQLPGPFDQGAELLWQVPIQKIHHRTDPILEPLRNPALPAPTLVPGTPPVPAAFGFGFQAAAAPEPPSAFLLSRGFSAEAVDFLPSALALSFSLPPHL